MAEAEKSCRKGTSTCASQVTPKRPGNKPHVEDMNISDLLSDSVEDLPSDETKGESVHSLRMFKAGLTKDEFTKPLELKLKVLAKSCDTTLQLDEVCSKRVTNLSAYITFRETKKDKMDKREKKSCQSFQYIQKCLQIKSW